MNEQLQSKLVEILTAIQSATKAGADFALEQLPDIAQQYVTYGRALQTFWLVVGVAWLTGAAVLIFMSVRQLKADADAPGGMVCLIASIFPLLIGLLTTATTVSAFAMVWFAPKVWLLKEIASLIK